MRRRPSATAASPAVFRMDDVLDLAPLEALPKNPPAHTPPGPSGESTTGADNRPYQHVDLEAPDRDTPLRPHGGVVRDPRPHPPRDRARPSAAGALFHPRLRRRDAACGAVRLRRRHAASRG